MQRTSDLTAVGGDVGTLLAYVRRINSSRQTWPPLLFLEPGRTAPGPWTCSMCQTTHEYRNHPIDGPVLAYVRGECACELTRFDEWRRSARESSRDVLLHAIGIPERHEDVELATTQRMEGNLLAIGTSLAFAEDYPNANGLIYHGMFGCGKTHMACATGKEVVRRHGVPVKFISAPVLLRRIKDRKETFEENMPRCHVLILDDVARTGLDKWDRDLMAQIVDVCYTDGVKLLMTTKHSPEDMAEEMEPGAMDRLREMCEWVRITNKSFRGLAYKKRRVKA